MNLINALKHIKAGIFFIILISVLLLLLDLNSRGRVENELPRIAVFKLSSRPLLDNTEKGIIDGLMQRGFVNRENVEIIHFCAENDLPTANTIAQNILNEKFDMVVTISTPILQVMANANQDGEIIHVFGAVTDPFASGVGLSREHPGQRPAHLAGVGTFQPVEDGLLIAREMNPNLNTLGVPWCSHEVCSEACVKIARKVTDSLKIEMEEVTVDNSSAVYEAVQSLIARGAEAIWVGGDNTVEIAMDMIVKATDDAGIPVFCNNPDMPEKGALFGLGANYYEVGEATAQVAAQILNGAEPASIPVRNVVPEKLYINQSKLEGFTQRWKITARLKERADKILD